MELLEQGRFSVGCNYWASHAGTNMWRDWRPDVVEADFARLSAHNIHLLRVFPLWPDFQPIQMLYGGGGSHREIRMGEEPLPDTPEGQAGVSEEALDKFGAFCALARKYDLRLIVGLVTGWMSGRLYVPRALEGVNALTDPAAVMWATRFVRCFVGRFRDEAAILAWDLGNECNCMAPVESQEQSYAWTSNIVGAIRSQDARRPIVSGMHGVLPEGKWSVFHQAELTDLLTTHPYPIFTPYCDAAPINTLRTEMHGTAETLLCRGLGRKPCFVEEAGSLGVMLGDEETAAAFERACLYSLWAHDCRGYLWWCANEQLNLTHAPYDWNAVERQLGLFRLDGTPKPVMREMEAFSRFLEAFGPLPPRIVDGVCVLSRGQDVWANAYMSFTLAKQAGLDIEFAWSDQPLPDAPLYLMPGVRGDAAITARRMRALLDKVENGALLYISLDNGLISGFESLCGLRVKGRERACAEEPVAFADGGEPLPLYVEYRLKLESDGAEVLARGADGNPMLTCHRYGKGAVMLLAAPLELALARRNGRIQASPAFWRVYQAVKDRARSEKVARIDAPDVGLTEHIADGARRILALVNYDPEPADVRLALAGGWRVSRAIRGNVPDGDALRLPGNDCAVLEISRAR